MPHASSSAPQREPLAPGAPPLDGRQATLLLVATMTVMAGATIAPALPGIGRAFPGDPLLVRLALTLPALLTALGSPVAGVLIDRFGRRRLLLASMVLYGVAGLAGGLAQSMPQLLAARALLGLSVGGVMTTAVTLVADYYRGPQRQAVMGRQSAVMSLGGVLFLTAGGALAGLTWRAPFAVYAFAFVLLPLAWRFLDEPDRTAGAAPEAGDAAAVPWPVVALLYGIGFAGMVVFYTVPVHIPFYLESRFGTAPGLVGLAIAAATLAGTVTSARYGAIRARLSAPGVLALSYGLIAAAFVVVGLAPSYGVVVAGLGVLGLGFGLLMPHLNTWLSAAVPAAARGRLLGGLTTAIFLGQFCSPLATQPLVNAVGLGDTFLVAAGAVGAAAVAFAGWALTGRTRAA